MKEIAFMAEILLQNWQRAVMGGIIVACSVIFLMGIFKKLIFDKIRNKLVRKVVLSFCSVLLVFPATALYFISDNISFDWYWWACLFASILTIVTYWLYENTGLRNLIGLIGELTVSKWLKVLYVALMDGKNNADTKNQLTMTTEQLKEEVRKEIHTTVKEDKDLYSL